MAEGARVGSVVMFVTDLDRSVAFYADVLGLEVADRSSTAVLLTRASGTGLILREMGRAAAHALGAVGVQYVVWAATDAADLARCEAAMTGRGAYRETRQNDGVTVIEGRDPDDIPVIVSHPGLDKMQIRKLPARIYGW